MSKTAKTSKIRFVRAEFDIPASVNRRLIAQARQNGRTRRGEVNHLICKEFGVDYDTINPSKIKKKTPWTRNGKK